MKIEELGLLAKKACPELYLKSDDIINETLLAVAKKLKEEKERIKKANAIDIENAKVKKIIYF